MITHIFTLNINKNGSMNDRNHPMNDRKHAMNDPCTVRSFIQHNTVRTAI